MRLTRVQDDESKPLDMPESDWDKYAPNWNAFEEFRQEAPMADLLTDMKKTHAKILADFAGISDDGMEAPNLWWEREELPVRHRLHRFEAHLRQHTVQVEKSLQTLNKPPTEAKRLLRLLFNGLAEVESGLLGVGEVPAFIHDYAQKIQKRADELAIQLEK